MNARWTDGNAAQLLENGEEFFPAVFDAIRAARREVIIETFILWEDKVGKALHAALVEAAGRGVSVDLMIDGFGSAELTPDFIRSLSAAGVRVRTFDPCPRILGLPVTFVRHFKALRRMHRKIAVVDDTVAFVGGINYSRDHLADFGPQAKQDYAVALRGPIVHQIRRFALSAIRQGARQDAPGFRERLQARRQQRAREREADRQLARSREQTPAQAQAGGPGRIAAMLVTRDNLEHHNDIERQYRLAIRGARRRVLIANAYFFPGYRLLRQLSLAARRGVEVVLVLQGEPDMAIVKTAASLLYDRLLRDGVQIYEYCEKPLHGKVAVVDDDWSTVGSSNLDPLSLSLNLEANVILRDADFAAELAARLDALIAHQCKRIEPSPPPGGWAPLASLRTFLTFHLVRGFPSWAMRLPRHEPRLELPTPPQSPQASPPSAPGAPTGLSPHGPNHAR